MIRYSRRIGYARIIHADPGGNVQCVTASYSMLSCANLVCTGRHSKPAVIYEYE